MISFDQIDALDALWLWRDRIPAGEVTILAGPGGTGKGMIATDVAARVSAARALPGGDDAPPGPGQVIIASTEDDSHVVLRPRLETAGADLAMVHDLSVVDKTPLSIPEHMDALADAVAATEAALVILDPLSAISPFPLASVARVRSVIGPLQRLANATGTSVLVLHHVTKAGTVAGSQAVWDSVRSVLKVARDPANPAIRVLSVAKSNMGTEAAPLRYAITDEGNGPHVRWLAETESAPGTGQAIILSWLEGRGLQSGRAVAAGTGLDYATARVLLSRLAAKGAVESPVRGWFTRGAVASQVSEA